MTCRDELDRLAHGPAPGTQPGGIGTIAIVGLCRQDGRQVAERCREVLHAVLNAEVGPTPDLDEWHKCLPRWFTDACAPEMSDAEAQEWLERWQSMTPEEKTAAARAQAWTLADWLHWFQPSERAWRFWDCQADRSSVRLILEIDAWPVAHEAVDWLLRAAGAQEIVTEDGT